MQSRSGPRARETGTLVEGPAEHRQGLRLHSTRGALEGASQRSEDTEMKKGKGKSSKSLRVQLKEKDF